MNKKTVHEPMDSAQQREQLILLQYHRDQLAAAQKHLEEMTSLAENSGPEGVHARQQVALAQQRIETQAKHIADTTANLTASGVDIPDQVTRYRR